MHGLFFFFMSRGRSCVVCSISSVAETRDGVLREFSREVEFMRWFPVAFLTNGVFIGTHGGIELAAPVL